MQTAAFKQAAPRAGVAGHSSRGRANLVVRASASRRGVLLGGASLVAVVASPLILVGGAEASGKAFLPVTSLSSFQKADQRTEYTTRVNDILRGILTAEDSPACIRLALHEAATYDIATKTGGMDGSIMLNSQEASLPVNSTLRPVIQKLKEAKKEIDAADKSGAGPISYADLIYLAGRSATLKKWYDIKIARSQTVSGGQTIAGQFANPWPAEIGRLDSTEASGNLNQIPALDADVETIRKFLTGLGAKPDQGSGPFTPKPPFWEQPGFVLWTAAALDPEAEEQRFVTANPDAYAGFKKNYDISRKTVTSTNYEVDFAAMYNKLTRLGAKFDSTRYLYPIPVTSIV